MASKKGMEMPFSWMFAIIAGSVILLIAIYATTKYIGTAEYLEYTEAAKSITSLIDPLETGAASSVGDTILFREETKTHYNCYSPTSGEPFGKQTIAFSEKSGLGKEWASPGGEITIRNKFIFADEIEQGKEMHVFSKPFFSGFKVTDLLMISAEDYCFVSPPEFVKEDIAESLNFRSLNVSENIEDCLPESKKVCFGSFAGCDIKIESISEFETGVVRKKGAEEDGIYYAGNLIYAAIFSDSRIYECNIKRLGSKISETAKIYNQKAEFVSIKNCESNLGEEMSFLSASAGHINQSSDILLIYAAGKAMDEKEKEAECKIYS